MKLERSENVVFSFLCTVSLLVRIYVSNLRILNSTAVDYEQ